MRPEKKLRARAPKAAEVKRLADDARLAVLKLFAEVSSEKEGAPRDAIETMAWSTARLAIDVLAETALRRNDENVWARQELVRAFARLRYGRKIVRAIELTASYAADVRTILRRGKAEKSRRKPLRLKPSALTAISAKIRLRLAKEYLAELRALELEEFEGKHEVTLERVAAELASEPRSARPRGPEKVLARLLLLHRDGAIDDEAAEDLSSTFRKAKTDRVKLVSRRSAE